MSQKIISALTRVKDDNGEYVLILPINTVEDVLVDLNTGETLADLISNIVKETDDTRLTVIEDLSSVVNALAGLIDVKLPLNHIYRENFKNTDNILKTAGTFFEGGVRSLQGQSIDFKLINPIDLKSKPDKFKITHISKYIGSPAITCLVTFNAKDTSPSWFDCKEVFTTGLFAEVPNIPNKEENKPYSLNIQFKCTCDSSSTFELNDLSILYV